MSEESFFSFLPASFLFLLLKMVMTWTRKGGPLVAGPPLELLFLRSSLPGTFRNPYRFVHSLRIGLFPMDQTRERLS